MPSKRSAVAALKKLETERAALAVKQRDLELKAAQEIGSIFLGSGVENFSRVGLKRLASALGSMGETEAMTKLGLAQS